MLHKKLLDLVWHGVDVFDEPDRSLVSDVVAKNYRINVPGVGLDYWQPDDAPYMIEPMNCTMSRDHNLVVFVGPARAGKSVAMINGLIVYTVLNRPVDFAVIRSSQDNALIFSETELARLHEENPELLEKLGDRKKDDRALKKRYRSGILGLISHPSSSVFSEKTIPLMLCTDVGKWLANIGGHGSGLEQAMKRTQTAGSQAMTVAESSPGSVWIDPSWKPGETNSHEFPPTTSGAHADICPYFNAGDRRWWYVPCQSCGEFYPQEPSLDRFSWPSSKDPDAAAKAGTVCISCGEVQPETTKHAENLGGRWLKEGQKIDRRGDITGEPTRPNAYPSFALGGGAAAFQSRSEIAAKVINAEHLRDTTGDETTLQTIINGDIGAPHKPLSLGEVRSAHPLMARAEELGKWVVPKGVRFIIATVDIQKLRFVVQVHGYGLGETGKLERWIIDRYNIKNSDRVDRADDDKRLPVQPQIYLEDWEQLTPLIEKSYPLADKSGRRMSIMSVFCDSGGEDGVTLRAYDYWRALKGRANLQGKFRLVKGAGHKTAKLMEETWPDTSGRRDRGASRGDVPVMQLNTGMLKDRLAHDLNRDKPGTGFTHFPKWLRLWWYREMTREQRTPDGWQTMSPNEAWILTVYADAAAIWGPLNRFKKHPFGVAAIDDWTQPPEWAKDWDENPYVFDPSEKESGGSKPIDVSQLMF